MDSTISIDNIEFRALSDEDIKYINTRRKAIMNTHFTKLVSIYVVIYLISLISEITLRVRAHSSRSIWGYMAILTFVLVLITIMTALFVYSSRKLEEFSENVLVVDAQYQGTMVNTNSASKPSDFIFFSVNGRDCTKAIKVYGGSSISKLQKGSPIRVIRRTNNNNHIYEAI